MPLRGKSLTLETYTYLQTVLLAAILWFLTRHFYHDDSYISLRYAQHLIEGNGFVWNPGERVEGFTNFLFVVLLAMMGSTGAELVEASRQISTGAFLALVGIMCWYTNQWPWLKNRPSDNRSLTGALAISLVATSLPLIAWCNGGLETNLFACLLAAGCCLNLHMLQGKGQKDTAIYAGIVFALATLTRPEGSLLFGFSYAFLWAAHFVGRGRYAIRPLYLCWMLTCYLLIYVPYSYWRITYFGELLPNTYYAKLYGLPSDWIFASGLFYLVQYAFMPPLLLVFTIAIMTVISFKTRFNPSITYLFLLAVIFCGYIISIGGDHMGYFRFMAPLVPVLALLMYHLGLVMLDIGKEKLWRDWIASLLFFSVFQLGLVTDKHLSTGALSGLLVSDFVDSHWPKDSTIALNPAGALPYYAFHYNYIDMLGLNDKIIARRTIHDISHDGQRAAGHAKGDGAYVLSRRPDYIIFGMVWGSNEPFFLSDHEIAAHPDFKKHYTMVETYLTIPPDLLDYVLLAEKEEAQGLALNVHKMLRFVYFQRNSKTSLPVKPAMPIDAPPPPEDPRMQ